ncbi:MAG: hypothetical protein ACK50L_08265 [Bacteroidota bacterium]
MPIGSEFYNYINIDHIISITPREQVEGSDVIIDGSIITLSNLIELHIQDDFIVLINKISKYVMPEM